MKRAQSEVLYLVITIGIAFILAAGVFVFSKTFRADLNEQLAAAGLERTSAQLESGFLTLKGLMDNTGTINASLKLPLPNMIGEQRYAIEGSGTSTMELRTIGDPSISKFLTIKFWNVNIYGNADSSQGFVRLELQNSTSVLLK